MTAPDGPIVPSGEVKQWLYDARDHLPAVRREAIAAKLVAASMAPIATYADPAYPVVTLRPGVPTLYGVLLTLESPAAGYHELPGGPDDPPPAQMVVVTFYRTEGGIVALTVARHVESTTVSQDELMRAIGALGTCLANQDDPRLLPLPNDGEGHRWEA